MENYKKITIKRKANKMFLWLRGSLLVLTCIFSVCSQAGVVPNFDKPVSLVAREQPIAVFLQELFGQINVPVLVDTRVDGAVNGNFSNTPAEDVFKDIGRSFGLVVYYDGAVANVYTSNNVAQRFLSTPKHITSKILNSAYGLKLPDAQNQLRTAKGGGLVVRGSKRFIEQIEELVYAAKSNSEFYEQPLSFKVFYLKYAWAQDVTMNFSGRQVVIPGIGSMLRFLTGDGSNSAGSMPQEQLRSPKLKDLKGTGLAAVGTNGRLGLDGSSTTGISANGGAFPVSPHASTSDVRIAVDPRLNAVIVKDSPDRMSRYKALIDSLDVEPQMIEVEATIIDINTDRLRELGVNWRGIRENREILFGNGTTSDNALNTPVDGVTPAGRGGFFSFVTGNRNQFIGRINALEAQGAAQVVSSPHVITLSNVEAIFDTSSTFFIPVAGQEEVDLFDVSVGTSLRVTPHVFKDNGDARIKLLVTIEDGQQENQTVQGLPVIRRSVINTQALINANESVLVGGLVRELTEEDVDKVPLLGDVPFLGHLFKTSRKGTTRVERMFLISPRLTSSSALQKDKKKLALLEKSSVISSNANTALDKKLTTSKPATSIRAEVEDDLYGESGND